MRVIFSKYIIYKYKYKHQSYMVIKAIVSYTNTITNTNVYPNIKAICCPDDSKEMCHIQIQIHIQLQKRNKTQIQTSKFYAVEVI